MQIFVFILLLLVAMVGYYISTGDVSGAKKATTNYLNVMGVDGKNKPPKQSPYTPPESFKEAK